MILLARCLELLSSWHQGFKFSCDSGVTQIDNEVEWGVRHQQKPVSFSSPPTAAAAAILVRLLQSVLWGRLAGPGLG